MADTEVNEKEEEEEAAANEQAKVVFKRKPRKNLRQRRDSDDKDEKVQEKAHIIGLDEIKERQRMRQRPKGVSLAGLALGKKLALEEEISIKDPFNIKMGGLVPLHALRSGRQREEEDPYDVGIGTQFSAETNKRDEDEEMMKYIEGELKKRQGVATANGNEPEEPETEKYMSPEDAALLALPEHLRKSLSHRSEEMLSNQMLNGIPEVDLGIDAKIKNIEATEEAKQKMIQDQLNKKDGPSQFVPANMAVNFMQHNRFKIDDNSEPKRRRQDANHAADADQQKHDRNHSQNHIGSNGVKRATDDYHYDKFKKQYRRF